MILWNSHWPSGDCCQLIFAIEVRAVCELERFVRDLTDDSPAREDRTKRIFPNW
jgi:hypothetical protein